MQIIFKGNKVQIFLGGEYHLVLMMQSENEKLKRLFFVFKKKKFIHIDSKYVITWFDLNT